MKIFKTTDVIKVKVNDITLHISPFKFEQKQEILGLIQTFHSSQDVSLIIQASKLAIKYGLKKVEGIQNFDDTEYEIEMDEYGVTPECIEDLMNCEFQDKICSVVTAFLNGVPKQIKGEDGKKMEGVEVKLPKSKKKAPKKTK